MPPSPSTPASNNKPIPLLPLSLETASTPPRHTSPPQSKMSSPNPHTPAPQPIPHSDALLPLTRQTTHLQSTLQSLLDAQSEGLLAGLAGTSNGTSTTDDGSSSVRSRTPTTTEYMLDSHSQHRQRSKTRDVVPVRQPTKKKVGLRGARRGIARVIGELADVKREEERVLRGEVGDREEVLATVEGFERKTTGLKEKIRGVEGEEDARRVEGMKQEEERLGVEIQELETRLWQMKSRQKALGREIESLRNGVMSRLSSYEAALRLAEGEVRGFLGRPPMGRDVGARQGIWALPKERRTLEMCREWYEEEKEGLRGRLEGVEKEVRALEEGGEVWREVVDMVDGVERALREEMGRIRQPLVEMEEGSAVVGMKGIVGTMSKARTRIEQKLDLAEKEDWKLLICCIGAELEALIEGQTVLEAAMEAAQGDRDPKDKRNGGGESRENGVVHKEQPLVDDASAPTSRPQGTSSPVQGLMDRSEDEDDGPGPEFLISHHDE